MPVTALEGPLGLEAHHIWQGGGGFTLNDLMSGVPRARLTRITGLHDLPEAEDPREHYSQLHFETAYPGFTKGKTIVYEGFVEGIDLHQVRAAVTAMRQAFSDRTVEADMTVVAPAAYGALPWSYRAKCIAFECVDEPPQFLNRLPYKEAREFALTLRAADARFWQASTATGAGNPLAGGGIW